MRRLKSTFLLLFFTLLVSFLLGEIIVRFFVVQETKRLATYDKELGWRGTPNGEGTFIRLRDDIRTPFRFNNIGFRDDDYLPKQPGQKRLVLLGDSFVESLEVPVEKTFHALLEKQFQASSATIADVAILASQGYSTAQEILALRKFQDVIQPDYVFLVFYTGNDFENNLRRKFAFLNKKEELVFPPNKDSWLRIQYLSAQRWLYENSHLVFFLKNLIQSNTQINLADNARKTEQRSDSYKHQITRALIAAAREDAQRFGAQFAMVVVPSRGEVRRGDDTKTNIITAFCQAENIPCLNLFSLLSEEHYFAHDIHFNDAGHQLTAEKIRLFWEENFSEKVREGDGTSSEKLDSEYPISNNQ